MVSVAGKTLRSATRHHALSALLAREAVSTARKARPQGLGAVAAVVISRQAAAASQGDAAIAQMLVEQSIDEAADALLNSLSFTTGADDITAMLTAATDPSTANESPDLAFDRLVASLVQEAGRAAEQVAVTTRDRVGWTRLLTPPSCSRCAVLAGRIYRYSEGFLRHPHDDCVTVAVREGDKTHAADVEAMIRDGQITDLSKADAMALRDGADLGQLVNVRSRAAGLTRAGAVLSRGGRPTPAAIYAGTRTREQALTALKAAGYIT